MSRVVLDSYALMTWLLHQNGWEVVENLLHQIQIGEVEGYMSEINLAEICYQIERRKGKEMVKPYIQIFEQEIGLRFVLPQREDILLVAEYKAVGNISLADCFALVLSKKLQAGLITGDKEFKQFENELGWIIWI